METRIAFAHCKNVLNVINDLHRAELSNNGGCRNIFCQKTAVGICKQNYHDFAELFL